MNKGDIINEISKVACSKAEAERILNAFLDTVKKDLKKGNKVTLIGFGTFSVVKRAARKGRNPKTGAALKIAAKKVPKFTAGKELKLLVAK